MITQSDDYLIAINGLLYFAQFNSNIFIQAQKIAKHLSITTATLTNVFRILVDGGLLSSIPGPKGGYALTKPVEEITLFEIKKIAEKNKNPLCILGIGECQKYAPCSCHKFGQDAKKELDTKLKKITLKEAHTNLKEKEKILDFYKE